MDGLGCSDGARPAEGAAAEARVGFLCACRAARCWTGTGDRGQESCVGSELLASPGLLTSVSHSAQSDWTRCVPAWSRRTIVVCLLLRLLLLLVLLLMSFRAEDSLAEEAFCCFSGPGGPAGSGGSSPGSWSVLMISSLSPCLLSSWLMCDHVTWTGRAPARPPFCYPLTVDA